jgi:hypothetical protein
LNFNPTNKQTNKQTTFLSSSSTTNSKLQERKKKGGKVSKLTFLFSNFLGVVEKKNLLLG